MERLTSESIRRALGALATTLPIGTAPRELWVVAPGELVFSSPALLVRAVAVPQLLAMKLSAWRDDLDVADARLLLSKLSGDKVSVWVKVEPHLVPGRELKARYAFDDVWEADRGPV